MKYISKKLNIWTEKAWAKYRMKIKFGKLNTEVADVLYLPFKFVLMSCTIPMKYFNLFWTELLCHERDNKILAALKSDLMCITAVQLDGFVLFGYLYIWMLPTYYAWLSVFDRQSNRDQNKRNSQFNFSNCLVSVHRHILFTFFL